MRATWHFVQVLFWVAAVASGMTTAARADEAAGAGAWDQVPVVRLHEAVAAGTVAATGRQPQSYAQVTVRLSNRTQGRIAVDVAGSYLAPKRPGSCQRLGIGPAVTPSGTDTPVKRRGPGTVVVELEPGATTDFVANTCCLDSSLACPTNQEFVGAAEPLPAVRETVLRWWADNPTAPQSAVNQAIWNDSPTVHIAPGVVPNFERPKGRFAAVHRGTCWRIVDGELTATDSEGVVRLVGSEVFQVFPTDEGVYAVALGEDRKPRLFIVPMTGEARWKEVLALDGTARVTDVLPAQKGNLVLVTDKGLRWFDDASGRVVNALETELFTFLSTRRPAPDRLTVTIRKPEVRPVTVRGSERPGSAPVSEIWRLSLTTGKAERAQQFWNVSSILCGPAGIFAVSHTQGRLRCLRGEKFEDVATEAEFRRIVAVATDVVWVVDAKDRLAAVNADEGTIRYRTEVKPGDHFVFDVDPATGDLVRIDGTDVKWLHAADGRETTLAPR